MNLKDTRMRLSLTITVLVLFLSLISLQLKSQSPLTPVSYYTEAELNNLYSREIDKSLPVGTTAGSFNVSATGAATYNIPIIVPPGIAGMAPQLSVVYSSQAGNGLLGMGWNLAGLSAISRVPQDMYHEDKTKGISFTSDDRFALDGNRLVAIEGEYGAANSVYHTESEMFAKITSNEEIIFSRYDRDGNLVYSKTCGPKWFKVETKDGKTIEYGNSIDSRVALKDHSGVLTWQINKISDSHGNSMEFVYHNDKDKGEFWIEKIKYTGTIAFPSQNYVQFVYSERADKNTMYIDGAPVKQNVVLNNIQTYHNNILVKDYQFKYNNAFYSQLVEVVEKASDGKQFNSTRFQWKEETGEPINPESIDVGHHDVKKKYFFGDFNGDGKTDIITVPVKENNVYDETDNWELFLSRGTNLFYEGKGSLKKGFETFIIADLNSDGLSDLIMETIDKNSEIINSENIAKNEKTIIYTAFLSNGDNFTEVGNPILCKSSTGVYIAPGFGIVPFKLSDALFFGEFDGDGTIDILVKDMYINGWKIYSLKKKNDGTFEGFYLKHSGKFPELGSETYLGDFNGDGLTDILIINDKSFSIYGFDENKDFNELYLIGNYVKPESWKKVYTGDFNGDGITDLLTFTTGSKWNFQIFTGGKNTLFSTINAPSFSDTYPNTDQDDKDSFYFIGDFNNDGKSDVFQMTKVYDPIDFITPIQSKYSIFYSESTSNEYSLQSKNEFKADFDFSKFEINFSDFNGDGNMEVLRVNKDINTIDVLDFKPGNKCYVQKVINGYNHETAIEYQPLTNNAVYSKANDAVYPLMDFQGPMFVVSSVKTSNGKSGDNTITYKYSGAKVHTQGKGFLGFARTIIHNNTTGDDNEINYEFLSNRFIPVIKKSVISQNRDGKDASGKYYFGKKFLISEINLVNEIKELSNWNTYFQTVKRKISTDYIKGNTYYDEISVDDYSNILTTISTTNDYVYSATTNEYAIAGSWCPSRLKSSIVQKQRYNEEAISRKVEYEYLSNGDIKKQITDPDKPKWVATEYTYDGFGNVKSITTSSPGLQSRNSKVSVTYNEPQQGSYKIITTNALTQQVDETHYDGRFGNAVLNKDINGLTTLQEYDGFGQLSKTILPNKKTIISNLYWADDASPSNTFYYSKTIKEGSPPKIEYYDILGRSFKTAILGFNNRWIFSDKEFNEKGQIFRVSKPYYENDPISWTYYSYDDYGRVLRESNSEDGLDEAPAGKPIGKAGLESNIRVYVIEHVYEGNKETVKNISTGHSTTKTFNSVGDLMSSKDAGGELTYIYNGAGSVRLIQSTNNGKKTETKIFYDEYLRQKTLDDIDAGVINYSYNAYGELESQIDSKGNTLNIDEYDLLGREISRNYNHETSVTYNYNSDAPGIGMLGSASTSDGTSQAYKYDELSRPVEKTEVVAGKTFKYSYSYDDFNRLKTLTYPSGYKLTYNYDENYGYLKEIIDLNGKSIWKPIKVNAEGQWEEYQTGNVLNTKKKYLDGLPQSIKTGKGSVSNTIQDLSYSFDPRSGNLMSRSDLVHQLSESFGYDDLNRLNKWSQRENLYSVSYNDAGNIDFKTDAGSYTYSGSGHAVSKVNDNPNSISTLHQQIGYNRFNKVATISEGDYSMVFAYGPDNERCKVQTFEKGTKLVKTKYYLDNSEYEVDEINNTTRIVDYIMGGDGLCAIHEVEGGQEKLYFVLKDYLGSIHCITNENGEKLYEYSFDPWGNRRNPVNWTYRNLPADYKFTRGFTGHEHLDIFGLINMNGRLYDPKLGRFLSPDNVVQDPAFTQSFNRYSYCFNNPLSLVDPTGYEGEVPSSITPNSYIMPDIPVIQPYLNNPTFNLLYFNQTNKNWTTTGIISVGNGNYANATFYNYLNITEAKWTVQPSNGVIEHHYYMKRDWGYNCDYRVTTGDNIGTTGSYSVNNSQEIHIVSQEYTSSWYAFGYGFVGGLESTWNGIKYNFSEESRTFENALDRATFGMFIGNYKLVTGLVDLVSKIPTYKTDDYVYAGGFATEKAAEFLLFRKLGRLGSAAGGGVGDDLVQIRHHTSPEAMKSIKNSGFINASRGKPYGVDFELGPNFVDPAQANFGQFGKGAYIELSVPRNLLSPIRGYLGASDGQGVRIVTGGSPLDINKFNPIFRKWKWF